MRLGKDIDHEASDGHLVKFPVPSADPRDPLNYPVWQKATALLIVSIYAFVANFTSSIVAPAIQVWPYTFPQDPRSISELTRLIAVCQTTPSKELLQFFQLANFLITLGTRAIPRGRQYLVGSIVELGRKASHTTRRHPYDDTLLCVVWPYKFIRVTCCGTASTRGRGRCS